MCEGARRDGSASRRPRRAVLVTLATLASGTTPPTAGDVVHAQVNLRIGETQFLRATRAGATREDARAGRLLMASCRWLGDSGARFAVRLPAGVPLPEGNHVELKLNAGADLEGEDVGIHAKLLRMLPYWSRGRTHCGPAANDLPR